MTLATRQSLRSACVVTQVAFRLTNHGLSITTQFAAVSASLRREWGVVHEAGDAVVRSLGRWNLCQAPCPGHISPVVGESAWRKASVAGAWGGPPKVATEIRRVKVGTSDAWMPAAR